MARIAWVVCWPGIVFTTASMAKGQCTPFFPPTECPLPEPLNCPHDILGHFCDADGWFVGPSGGGVVRIGNQVQLDQSCDGDVADPADLIFDLPTAIQNVLSTCPQCSVELRLSPSQEFLYAKVLGTTTNVPGCAGGQVRVYFYGLGTPPTLIPFSGPGQGSCMNSIAIEPRYYDRPGDPLRTAVLVAAAAAGKQAVMWADLAGMAVNLDTFTYDQGVQVPQFSQRGNAAFLRSVSGGFATRYYLIDLCRSPVGAAGAVSTASFPPSTNAVSAAITGDTDALFAVITHNGGEIDIPLDNCLCGACCAGTSCTEDESAADCGATFVPGSGCSPSPCGSPPEACCLPGGVCAHETASDCAAMGGANQPGMTCPMISCPMPTEACCMPSGACSDLEPGACGANGGTPDGPGTTCATASCPPPPGTEACCLPSGACLNLPPVGPFPSCAVLTGTPQGAGSNCLSGTFGCPTAGLTISKSGPASVQQGQDFTYTITFGNTGPSDSAGVTVRETLPAGATFLAASNSPSGAAPTVAGNVITWTIGALPAGVMAQQVTVDLRAGCNAPGNQIVNNNYLISGTPGGNIPGASVTTTVTPASQAGVGIAVSSVDLDGAPLKAGDLIEHTITLMNSAAEQRNGLNVGSTSGGNMSAGCVSLFESAVDAAGGTFNVHPSGTHFFWTGNLGPSATIAIVFTTRVNDCISAGSTLETLNCGQFIGVASPCGQSLGTVMPPDQFLLARPIAASLDVLNAPSSSNFGTPAYVAREGALLEFEIVLTEQYNHDHPLVAAMLTIPSGVIPDPSSNPLVDPPAGASYDPGTRQITFNGAILAGQTVSIRWNGILDSAGPCQSFLDLAGTVGTCNNISIRRAILKVPVMPQGPHIIGIDELPDNQGLWLMELGAVQSIRPLLCIGGEIFTGMERAPDGEVWMTDDVQLIRFNPMTDPLQIEVLGADVLESELGLRPRDAAFDTTSPERSLIIVGQQYGGVSAGRVRRFYPGRPPGQRVEVILDDPGLANPMRVSVDPEGMIAVMSAGKLVRINPTAPLPLAPGDYAEFNITIPTDLGGLLGTRTQSPNNLTVDLDGDYLVTVNTAFVEDFGDPFALPLRYTLVQSLVKIDRTSGLVGTPGGTPSVIVERLAGVVTCFGNCPASPPSADLSDVMFPGFDLGFAQAADVGSNGTAYIGSSRYPNRAFAVQRDGGVTGQTILASGAAMFSVADFAVVEPGNSQVMGDADGDGDVDLDDYLTFYDCMGGPGASPSPPPPTTTDECLAVFDFDGDEDVDLDDFGDFERLFAGP